MPISAYDCLYFDFIHLFLLIKIVVSYQIPILGGKNPKWLQLEQIDKSLHHQN